MILIMPFEWVNPVLELGFIDPAGIKISLISTRIKFSASTPHDHFRSGPDGRVIGSCLNRWGAGVKCRPMVEHRIVSAAIGKWGGILVSQPNGFTTPYHHPTSGPDSGMKSSPSVWFVYRADFLPVVSQWIVPSSIQSSLSGANHVFSTPGDHFRSGPDKWYRSSRARSSYYRNINPLIGIREILNSASCVIF